MMKKQSIIYLAVFLVLCFAGTALALNIDADSNNSVDAGYGGTNRTAACADGEMLLSDGTDYDCLATPDTDEGGTVDLDEIGDPGGNTSWYIAFTSLTIDGTNYNCIFSPHH
jgi:hypothetical protein